jgi:microsomal dipeptidase-like Zn-dependent dipeptidase
MAKHSETSWKPEKPINQLHNAVDKATHAVKQAQSHPSSQMIQQTKHSLERAEHGMTAAFLTSENPEPIERLQEQLDLDRLQLEQLQPIKDEQ